MQRQFKVATPMPDLGIRRQKLLVLWYTTMPGVLIELGFINNAHDRAELTSAAGKRKLAAAILGGLLDYDSTSHAVDTSPAPSVDPKPVKPELEKPKPDPVKPKREPKPAPKPAPAPDPTPIPKPAPAMELSGSVYVVQILSTTRKIPSGSDALKGADQPIERYRAGRYRYYIGPFDTRREAERKLIEIRRSFSDAFITTIEL